MAYSKKGGNTVEAVRRLAEPIAAGLGLQVWDVRFLKEGADWFLRIYIDKSGGISIEDCEAMSRAIDGPLDQLDPIEQSYCLEVSSPGLNRELVRDEHFAAFLGSPVRVRLIRPLDGSRTLTGILEACGDGTVTVHPEDKPPVSLALKETVSVRLMDDDFVGGNEENE